MSSKYCLTIEELKYVLNDSDMSLICVTGQMAAGKNYVCSQLEQAGWASLDADLLVHRAIEIARDRIITEFEPYAKEKKIKINKEDGSIDRRALGELLFSMPSLLKVQESIVYPIITTMIDEFIAEHPKTIINATVLYKTPELLNRCQSIIFVTAPLFKRVIRARNRDHLPYKQLFKRFFAQRNLLSKYKNANLPIYIVNNK